jgi:putative thioredoxin
MSENSELVFAATDKNFEQTVVQKSREVPVVVDFWAPWCGPCRSLAPVLEKHVRQRAGQVVLAKVNVDEEQGLAAQFNVSSIPMVVAFRDGKPLLEFVGLLPEPQLAEFFDRICPTEADRQAKQARELETSNPGQAEKLYRQVLKTNAHHEPAVLGLARVLLAAKKEGEAAELLDRVSIGAQDHAEVERLTALLWLRNHAHTLGDEKTLRERAQIDPDNAQLLYELGTVLAGEGKYPEALALLLKAGEKDRKLASSKVRETMVKIFQIIGVRSDLADEYRDKLSAMLY